MRRTREKGITAHQEELNGTPRIRVYSIYSRLDWDAFLPGMCRWKERTGSSFYETVSSRHYCWHARIIFSSCWVIRGQAKLWIHPSKESYDMMSSETVHEEELESWGLYISCFLGLFASLELISIRNCLFPSYQATSAWNVSKMITLQPSYLFSFLSHQ